MNIDTFISKDSIRLLEADVPKGFYGTIELRFQSSKLKVVSVVSTFITDKPNNNKEENFYYGSNKK